MAVAAGSLLVGDGWNVRVPKQGRWQPIHHGGNQTACRGLQEIPSETALSLSTSLTVCPEHPSPGATDPAAALLDLKESDLRRYAEQDRTKIRDLVHAPAEIADTGLLDELVRSLTIASAPVSTPAE